LAREKKKPRMDWAAVAIMKCHRNGVALAQQDPEAIRGCSTSEDPNARRLPCQAPVSLLPFVSQLLTMRSNRKPYVVALEPYSPKRIHQSSICRIQHACSQPCEACRAKELAAADQLSKPRHRREMNHVVRSRPVQAQVMVAERIGYSVQEEPSSLS